MRRAGVWRGVVGVVFSATAMILSVPMQARAAVTYSLADLGTLGGVLSVATGINASGQVVGVAYTFDNAAVHAFMSNESAGPLIDLGSLGGDYSGATAINASGQVVGHSFTTGTSLQRAFVTDHFSGSMIDLGTLGGNYSGATGINASGQVVGYADYDGTNTYRAFISTGTVGSMVDLGTLGGRESFAFGIGDSGQVVGAAAIAGYPAMHAFLSNGIPGSMIDLGTLGGSHSQAYGINAQGQVVGYASTTGDTANHAFVSAGTPGSMVDLGTLGGSYSFGASINTRGQIVGISSISGTGEQHAFVSEDTAGSMLDLNALLDGSGADWTIVDARAINDVGQIVGQGCYAVTRECHAVLLTPISSSEVPLPGSLALLLGGCIPLLAQGGHRPTASPAARRLRSFARALGVGAITRRGECLRNTGEHWRSRCRRLLSGGRSGLGQQPGFDRKVIGGDMFRSIAILLVTVASPVAGATAFDLTFEATSAVNGSPYPVSSLPSPYYVIRVELDRTIRLPEFTDAAGRVTNPVDNIMSVSSPDPTVYIKTTYFFDDVVQGNYIPATGGYVAPNPRYNFASWVTTSVRREAVWGTPTVQGGIDFRTSVSFQTGTRANALAISGLWGPEMEFAGPESFLAPGAVWIITDSGYVADGQIAVYADFLGALLTVQEVVVSDVPEPAPILLALAAMFLVAGRRTASRGAGHTLDE